MKEEKIIMYDSPEAATYKKNIEGWISSDGRYFGKNEHLARWAGCTHMKCKCGNAVVKGWTNCDECRRKSARDRYNALPFREWDGQEVVCTWDGDEYFFNEDELISYMEDQYEPMESISLLICEPNEWTTISGDYWSDILPEETDGELPNELQSALDNLNTIIKSLSPCSYSPGKIRTSYSLTPSLDDK